MGYSRALIREAIQVKLSTTGESACYCMAVTAWKSYAWWATITRTVSFLSYNAAFVY